MIKELLLLLLFIEIRGGVTAPFPLGGFSSGERDVYY